MMLASDPRSWATSLRTNRSIWLQHGWLVAASKCEPDAVCCEARMCGSQAHDASGELGSVHRSSEMFTLNDPDTCTGHISGMLLRPPRPLNALQK